MRSNEPKETNEARSIKVQEAELHKGPDTYADPSADVACDVEAPVLLGYLRFADLQFVQENRRAWSNSETSIAAEPIYLLVTPTPSTVLPRGSFLLNQKVNENQV